MSKVTFGGEFPPVVWALQMFAHDATIGEACVAMRALVDKCGESVVDARQHVRLSEQHHTLWCIVQQICTAQHWMPRIA
jgi:hypothetical protein